MVSVDYIKGFIDGEGSFIIRFRKDNRYRTGIQIEPHINITQKKQRYFRQNSKANRYWKYLLSQKR